MGEIVLGLGSSHSPQVSAPAAAWPDFARSDVGRAPLSYRGVEYGFDELAGHRADAGYRFDESSPQWEENHQAAQRAIDQLRERLEAARPDVVVIVGDDQDEVVHSDIQPALLIPYSPSIHVRPRHYAAAVPEGVRATGWAYGTVERDYPVASDLAAYVIEELSLSGVDVASSDGLPAGSAIGHAFAFVLTRLLGNLEVPIIPVMLNTYFGPNQPTAARCFEIGRKLADSVRAWPQDTRVAVVASGGLSHFVLDEDLDDRVLAALQKGDVDALAQIPRNQLVSGTSEILNWVLTAGAVTHLEMSVVSYMASYRSRAGTGCGMAFATWE